MRLVDADRADEVIIFDKDNENINVAAVKNIVLSRKYFLINFLQ